MDIPTDALAMRADLQVLAGVAAGPLLELMTGSLPGLTAAMAIARLIPLTFGMGLLLGAIVGGAAPAILRNIPGTPSSVATTLDGFPMARRGRDGAFRTAGRDLPQHPLRLHPGHSGDGRAAMVRHPRLLAHLRRAPAGSWCRGCRYPAGRAIASAASATAPRR
ncbi:tripartite tricarboxylate transporter permease [Poseidonocella sp. HB161398]|uniref:tripartite tricarboxylate transporter permease n=1 Tax=Poseidonocella sp. HB161398 TaxID=2320855 RepID=UPI001109AA6E|nr:tripartite tricarboxylate transporter permease [Poseidonocella sp. HB161398]